MDNIGARLRDERERLGKNQDAFAALAGVGKRALIHYEKSERSPDANFLAAIAAAGADVLYILTGQRSGAAAAAPVAAEPPATQLSRRALAVAQNYEATSEEGKKIIEAAAFAAAKPAAKRGAKAA